MKIVGFDLSLTSPGMAAIDTAAKAFSARAMPPPPKTHGSGHPRLAWIVEAVREHAQGAALAVVEEPAYGAKGDAVHVLAGLWTMCTHELWRMGIPTAVVNVGSLKLYATGNGSAGKDQIMLTTGRAFPAFEGNNDAADALWLACMGAEHVGHPLVEVEAKRRAALNKVTWPQGVS